LVYILPVLRINIMKRKILFFILTASIFFILPAGCTKEEKPPDPVTDTEGNIYKTIKIGTQVWMAENLRSTKFNDGTDITLTAGSGQWNDLSNAGYCWYDNDEPSFRQLYGALYNGYTVVTGKLCPDGWHIPEKQEWLVLREFLGDSIKAGGKMKETGTENWQSPNRGADNSSGFTAVAAGIRYFEGTFSSNQSYTSMWSATDASQGELWCTSLYFADTNLSLNHRSNKYGFSVRCIKN
jgi:uncharacterized protein (TIGR02145 family)